ncbi:hypothetical protein STRAU_2967 [Streptomyces aurantiacus JA 4570]|uniref:GntR C-terminal domain-containing protein n=2 Tax=Streptomyces aurantiacus TaxID=47760 RepID=S3ZMG4_9ACTN|nr:hypothetical protein STRAU_2967 [Streptomyces aurantiacus JA 4570]
MHAALTARRAAAPAADAAFIDADIALHASVVAAAHNPVLTDLFGEFVPALREGLVALLDLVDIHREESDHGDAAHEALVLAVESGDPEEAERVALAELEATFGRLKGRGRA